jgi:hypothetical protein
MPSIPTALPDPEKIRDLIWKRGYSQSAFARMIGRPPRSLFHVLNDKPPRPVSIIYLRQIARGLSTSAKPVKPSDISDLTDDDLGEDPETGALASLDAKKGPAVRAAGPAGEKTRSNYNNQLGREPPVTHNETASGHRPLKLEIRDQEDKTPHIGPVVITPPVDEDYWAYRVRLTEAQAIVGFPKFMTIGIGFAQEEDWNTNFPYTCDADEIWQHIRHNKGDDSISDEDCIAAIRLIQGAIKAAEVAR